MAHKRIAFHKDTEHKTVNHYANLLFFFIDAVYCSFFSVHQLTIRVFALKIDANTLIVALIAFWPRCVLLKTSECKGDERALGYRKTLN